MINYSFFTSKEIKPKGWLKRQLRIQAEGLSGNLDKVWPSVRDSAWFGGDNEGWERVPYWLDGFVPLAYLLKDAEMIERANRYVNFILNAQKQDGWICPCEEWERSGYDTWAVLLISKVLTVYYDCSGDKRVPGAVYKILKNYYELLKNGTVKLFKWGKFRWYEGIIAIKFVYERDPEPWLLELARILRDQGADYNEFKDLWIRPMNAHRLETHIVNVAMALKYEALTASLLGEEYTDAAEGLIEVLAKYNGTPVGLFTGDECLSGRSPIQGTELCAVVEQMYSYEHLLAATGDAKWADRLEMLAFNALPAAISDDMWTHQYDQMSNQIACIRFSGKPIFRTNGKDAHLFGLEPHFGCCTANFNQGWPKLALSAFMHKGDEIICQVALPSVLDCDKAHIELETDYPFKNSFIYKVSARNDFKLKIRIPHFARDLKVNGGNMPTRDLEFEYRAGQTDEIFVCFETEPYFEEQIGGLYTVKCGSLAFALPIGYKKKMLEYVKGGVERKFPYCDYEYIPTSDWSFGYGSDELLVERYDVDEVPFSSQKPAIAIKAAVKSIEWGFEEGYDTVCAKFPESTEPTGEMQSVKLWPYGCAKLRMTELPKV